MNKRQAFLIALFDAVVGCAATQVAQVHYADAQYEPGQIRECAAMHLDGLRMVSNIEGHSVQVPPGWTPVGGTSSDQYPGVVVCR